MNFDFLYCNENNVIKVISNEWETPINIISINTKKDEFAPFFNTLNKKLLFNSTINGYSLYYTTTFDTLLNFSSPILLNSLLNANRQNRSYFTLLNQNEALISGFNYTEYGTYLNIQKTIYQRNTWSEPSKIIEFSDTFFTSHPTSVKDGQILIYSTNKNNPYITTDLWYASLQADGSWTMLSPLNELNSIGNEITPYLLNDSVLIFASDGFSGLGGYDLYYSINYAGTWSNPQPIDGINTEFNESDCIVLPDGTLIFSSDRPGGQGGLDLYYAKSLVSKTKPVSITPPFHILSSSFELITTRSIFYELDANGKYFDVDTFYTTTPDALEIALTIDTMPDEIITVKYAIICDEVKLLEKEISNNIYDRIYLDINAFAEKIANCNLLKIEATLTTQQQISSESIEINIIKNNEKEQKIYTTDTEENYQKIPTYHSDKFTDYCAKNSNNLDVIKKNTSNTRKIEIIGNINEKFVKELAKYFNYPSKNISITKSNEIEYITYLIYK